MRGFAAEHAVADLALGILHEEPPLRALHEDDEAARAPIAPKKIPATVKGLIDARAARFEQLP